MYCMSYLCLTCHNITLVTNSCICFSLNLYTNTAEMWIINTVPELLLTNELLQLGMRF